MVENGVIIRNIMDAIALCPPLIIEKPQIDDLVDAIEKSLDQVSASISA